MRELSRDEPPPKFGLGLRVPLVGFGILSIGAALPLVFVILIFLGGGHGNPFGPGIWSDWVFRVALLGIPALLIALGLASLLCVNRCGLRRMAVIGALIPTLMLVAMAAAAYSNSARKERTALDPCGDLPATACTVIRPARTGFR